MYGQPVYGQHAALAATGLTGSGVAFGLPLGWLLLATFVLTMAAVAIVTIAPRRVREVRKVNPKAAARMRLATGG